ncbi:MAG: tetratricopeptide repeat protein [Pikeienuella sp.]|uniref:tetratricopeptide repeat protein n=1 Tax=Pikeienuella sp. TaxID=2831957 RepID=UPI00391C9E65
MKRALLLLFPLVLAAPAPAAAQDGSLARCGALSAPAAEVAHHCRRALERGGLRAEQAFAAGLNLGDALIALGRAGEAKAAFAAAAETGREAGLDRVELHLGIARAEEALGDRRAAATAFDRALALAPRSVDVRLARGAFWLRLGQGEAALEEFDAALRLDGGDADARFNRGLTLLTLGRDGAAEADFSAVIRDYPRDSGAFFHRARAREAARPEAALGDYDEAAALAPEWADPWLASARLLDRVGRREDANARYRRAFELGAKDPALLERIRALGG